jgi:HD superfamily phosphohydrolase YqeK
MQTDQLNALKTWFDTYSRGFLTGNGNVDSPLVLKIDHTRRVCANIRRLARAVDAGSDRLNLAEAVGLFHDVGRFEQYRRFATFNDRMSLNHAALGVDILKSATVLDALPESEQTIIIDAVRFHNAPSLPTTRNGAAMLFMRLIRDADKLDIWKVFADYYRQAEHPVAAIVQHLPDEPSWSSAIVGAIMENRMARFKDMSTLNDFKLLQLSWVFDLQFAETAKIARERDDLEVISGTLPDDATLARAVAHLMKRLAVLEANVPSSRP